MVGGVAAWGTGVGMEGSGVRCNVDGVEGSGEAQDQNTTMEGDGGVVVQVLERDGAGGGHGRASRRQPVAHGLQPRDKLCPAGVMGGWGEGLQQVEGSAGAQKPGGVSEGVFFSWF